MVCVGFSVEFSTDLVSGVWSLWCAGTKLASFPCRARSWEGWVAAAQFPLVTLASVGGGGLAR